MVFYHEIRAILDKFIQINKGLEYMQYSDFYELKEIGSGGYGTVYIAKYKGKLERHISMAETIALKRFNNFDQTAELFINEVSISYIIN